MAGSLVTQAFLSSLCLMSNRDRLAVMEQAAILNETFYVDIRDQSVKRSYVNLNTQEIMEDIAQNFLEYFDDDDYIQDFIDGRNGFYPEGDKLKLYGGEFTEKNRETLIDNIKNYLSNMDLYQFIQELDDDCYEIIVQYN